MKKIPYGISNYEELITEGYYYVDKTKYLKDLETGDKKLIYLRPRRFGKTLFTSMMYYYYDINSSDKFDTLFKDTYIYIEPTSLRNSYYVLKFDFSGLSNIMSDDKKDIEYKFNKIVISSLKTFIQYYDLEINVNFDMNQSPADNLLDFFTEIQMTRKIYIIIDEYDNFTNAILQDNANIFKSILGKNGFVKDFYARIKAYCGTIVDRVFITGVCSVSLDAMTSGFNIATNITNYSMFNAMTALTHEEVKTIIKDMNIDNADEIFNIMLKNYDGYKFSDDASELVFNSTLVIYFLNYYNNFKKLPKNIIDYNILSNYEQIKGIIKLNNNHYYNDVLLEVINNNKISSKLKEKFELDGDFRREDIISMLYYFGYLTIDNYNDDKQEYNFILPNKIITDVFINYFNTLLNSNNIEIDNNVVIEALTEMAETGKIDSITNIIRDTLNKFSNRMYIGFSERVIQSMYLMLLKYNNTFRVFDELEVYEGYVDLILFGDNELSNYDIMIELKYIKKDNLKEKTIENTLARAKEQIDKYDKDDRIKSRNKKMLKYAVIFAGDEYQIYEI